MEETFTGYIYKISSPHTEKVYIGSTKKKLKRRLQEHINDYTRYLQNKRTNVTSFEVIKMGDPMIELVGEHLNITTYELQALEAISIRNTINTVNRQMPNRTRKEWNDEFDYNQKYYDENRDALLKQKQQYYADNTEKIRDRGRVYYDGKKELLKHKTNCVCGSIIRTDQIARHNKSKKHLAYIASLAHTVINIQNLTINNK